jgi:hypothetical protein
VHALPSLHVVPFVASGFEHTPVAGAHVPATWHSSLAVHTTGFEPTPTPDWHESVWVHALPSSQAVPSGWPAHVGAHAPGPGVVLTNPETVPLNTDDVVESLDVPTTKTKFDCGATVNEKVAVESVVPSPVSPLSPR